MGPNPLTAISPIDGRYRSRVNALEEYFSEFALIRYRIKVEVEYFIELCQIPLPQLKGFEQSRFADIQNIYRSFTPDNALRVKEIERITNHDIKAVEYYIKEKFEELQLESYSEYIHFGLTSQDINNTAIPLMLRDALNKTIQPELSLVLEKLIQLADEWSRIPMLARTHGQPASPTRLGKEIYVFVERLIRQIEGLKTLPHSAKFGGATGNFNAHHAAYPEIDWAKFSNQFVNQTLGLQRQQTTTQIEHYDGMAAIFDNLKRINVILLDLCRDMWTYISMDYFKQKIKEGEVGSSAMPHKVNPIDFENAEGNLGLANALLEHLATKLPISRLQRDLSDSTVLRNIGVPLAHILISLKSILYGLDKLMINSDAIDADLERNWIVVAEGIQTILRREGFPKPYEVLKELTRTNRAVTKTSLHSFIDQLSVSEKVKKELKSLSPFNYIGIESEKNNG